MRRIFRTLRACRAYAPHSLLIAGLAGILLLAASRSPVAALGPEVQGAMPAPEERYEPCENQSVPHNWWPGELYEIWAGNFAHPYPPGHGGHTNMYACLAYYFGAFSYVMVTLVSDALGNPYCIGEWSDCFDQFNIITFPGCDYPNTEIRYDVYGSSWNHLGTATVPSTYIGYDNPSCS